MARDKTRTKRKERKNIAAGVAHVNSSFNNTKVLISDVQGNAIAWSSAGTMGFKGSRKSTPYAAQLAAEDAGRKAQEHGVRTLEVEVQGPGSGRESALRALAASLSSSARVALGGSLWLRRSSVRQFFILPKTISRATGRKTSDVEAPMYW